MLLAGDCDRVRLVEQPVPGRLEGIPPVLRIAFRAGRLRGIALRDDHAVLGPAEQDLGGLGGGVHARDKLA